MTKLSSAIAVYKIEEPQYVDTVNRLRRRLREIWKAGFKKVLMITVSNPASEGDFVGFVYEIWFRDCMVKVDVKEDRDKEFRRTLPTFLKITEEVGEGVGRIYKKCEVCRLCHSPLVLVSSSVSHTFMRCINCNHLSVLE